MVLELVEEIFQRKYFWRKDLNKEKVMERVLKIMEGF